MKIFSVTLPIRQEICIFTRKINVISGMKTNKIGKKFLPVVEKKYTYFRKINVNSNLDVSKFRGILKIKSDILVTLLKTNIGIEQLIVPELEEFRDMYNHNYFIYNNIDKLFDIYKALNEEYDLSDMEFELFLRRIDEHNIDTFKNLSEIF